MTKSTTAAAMTAHADGVQVTFVETYAQPSGEHDGSTDEPTTRKLDQVRPSLVIAGDTKALEVVRTVHSPKSAQSQRLAASASPKRRFSFSGALDGVVSQAKAATESEACSNWRLVWRKKFSESKWKGKMDFVLSIAALVYVSLRLLVCVV